MSERWLLIRRRSRQRRQSRLLRRRLQHRNDARPDFSHSPIWCAGSGLEELRMSVWKLSATDRRALNLRATASPLPKLAQSRHDRRRCRCQPSAGGRACTSIAIALIVGIPRLGSGADQAGHGRHVSFVLHLALENFPRVRPRVSASARIDRKKCPHRKAPRPSRRFLAARRVWQRSVRGRCNPGSGIRYWIYQTLD